MLPNRPESSESGVMNFDVFGGPGTHWVAWICRPAFTVYFDSFGVPMPDTMRAYLKKHPGTHWNNAGQIQSFDSNLCGYYCVDFVKNCHDAKGPQDVIEWLNEYRPFAGTNESKLISKMRK